MRTRKPKLHPELLLVKIEEHSEARFYTKNPWNRGYLVGLIDALNTVTGVSIEPPPLTEPYAESVAAHGDVGLEAIRLLGECPISGSCDGYQDWRKRIVDLLLVWQLNTDSEAIKTACRLADVSFRHDPVILELSGGVKRQISRASEIYDVQEVSDACYDGPDGWGFNRLVAVKGLLHVEQMRDDGKTRRLKAIGSLSHVPKWLRIPEEERCST